MILQEVLDILQMAANAGFAQTEVMLSVNNKTNEKIKSVDLINKTNANKFVFSTGETLLESKDILSLHFETKKEENA
jgi:hypothetical protein